MLWDPIAEETTSELSMDFTSCQMPRNVDTQRRLNMDLAMHDMVIDEMSFYNDESQDELLRHSPHTHSGSGSNNNSSNVMASHNRLRHAFADLAQPMGLLAPEGSPRRFQIVEKPVGTHKFRHTLGTNNAIRQQKLQPHVNNSNSNGNGTGTAIACDSTNIKTLRVHNSLSSSGSMESSMDDDYMELFEMESLEQNMGANALINFPSDLNALISGQIKSSSPAHRFSSCNNGVFTLQQQQQQQQQQQMKTPEMRRPSVRRCLSMTDNYQQPKTPETLLKQVQETATSMCTTPTYAMKLQANATTISNNTSCFKRPDPPSTSNSPLQIKRYRGDEKENLSESLTASLTLTAAAGCHKGNHPPPLRKCMSMNDAEIMSALARSDNKDEPDLIGDFSKPFVLPLLDGRHRDLKSISCDTLARLLRGEFDDQVLSYKIIDCRYPYEYEGGHIRGAQNLYTHEQIIEEFLTQQKTEEQLAANVMTTTGGKRNIIIFHCEFSSERGPKLSRFLRNNDRARNTTSYPTLDYPEIYLLHNGYKEFYEQHSELCDPNAYRPMLEPAYNSAYRHFRAKSKSWNGDGLGGASSRLKKSRSRLML